MPLHANNQIKDYISGEGVQVYMFNTLYIWNLQYVRVDFDVDEGMVLLGSDQYV